jgi:hypothetical protein
MESLYIDTSDQELSDEDIDRILRHAFRFGVMETLSAQHEVLGGSVPVVLVPSDKVLGDKVLSTS